MNEAIIQYNWCPYKKKKETPGALAQRNNHVIGSKRVAICKPRREASEEPDPIGTLILDF